MDIADKAQVFEDAFTQNAIANSRAAIPAGKEGECELCGEWSGRIVGGACAPCRDKYKIG